MCSIQLCTLADAEDIQAAAVSSVAEVGPWLPWCVPHYSLDDARQWIQRGQELIAEGLAYPFVIRSEAGEFLGVCELNRIDKVHRVANLGYWVKSSVMGRGVAPVAAKLLAAYAFEKAQLNRLEIIVAVDNIRSRRVAEKVCAVREGLLRSRFLLGGKFSDAILYSLVRTSSACHHGCVA